MTMSIINVVAEFERDLLIERTHVGLSRAKAEGKVVGRPSALSTEQQVQVRDRLAEGVPVAQLARDFQTSRQIIMRIRDASA
jgi:putative DNA-invertase from lambdoid prophage Rac